MAVKITDVTLRDGLQMEAKVYSNQEKYDLFRRLCACGYDRLEVTSFVHPKWIPQFQDAEGFLNRVSQDRDVPELMAFVPNAKGFERLMKFPIPWVSTFVAASETFNQKNINASIDDTVNEIRLLLELTRKEKKFLRVYVSTVFGCPFEGGTDQTKLLYLLKKVAELGPDEVALSDTIGVALPVQVKRIVGEFSKMFPLNKTALHFHNTYGMALANIQAGYEAGVRNFDGSTGGVGGCPYAKGATGNVASDEVMYLFLREGKEHGFDLAATQNVYGQLKRMGIEIQSHIYDITSRGGMLYGDG